VTAAVQRPRVGIVTDANLAPGDELIRVILDAGCLVRIRRPESSRSWSAFRDDVSIHVGPLTGVPARPGQLTVLLGTPDAAPSPYDVVISETPDQLDRLRAAIVPAISSRLLMV
jgi:hypothetical protein